MNLFYFFHSTPAKPCSDQLTNISYFSNSNENLVHKKQKHRNCNGSTKSSLRFTHTIVLKLVFLLMGLFFMAATYVQHNDPDPFLWMPVYFVPMFINILLIISIPPIYPATKLAKSCFCTKRRVLLKQFGIRSWNFLNKLITVHIAYCYLLGIWTLTNFMYKKLIIFEQVENDHIHNRVSEDGMLVEEAKELLGLCLVIAWLSFINNGNFLRLGWKGIFVGSLLTGLPIFAWITLEKLEEHSFPCFSRKL